MSLDLVRERTMAGLTSARVSGRLGGRLKVMDEKKAGMPDLRTKMMSFPFR